MFNSISSCFSLYASKPQVNHEELPVETSGSCCICFTDLLPDAERAEETPKSLLARNVLLLHRDDKSKVPHLFHKDCLQEWFVQLLSKKSDLSCPLCKRVCEWNEVRDSGMDMNAMQLAAYKAIAMDQRRRHEEFANLLIGGDHAYLPVDISVSELSLDLLRIFGSTVAALTSHNAQVPARTFAKLNDLPLLPVLTLLNIMVMTAFMSSMDHEVAAVPTKMMIKRVYPKFFALYGSAVYLSSLYFNFEEEESKDLSMPAFPKLIVLQGLAATISWAFAKA